MDDTNKNNNQTGDWYSRECGVKNSSNLDMSNTLWNNVSLDEEDLSQMFDDENTPIRSCVNLADQVGNTEIIAKESIECKQPPSQVKRRRMLQFEPTNADTSVRNEDLLSAYLRSEERKGSIENDLAEMSNWVSGFAENSSSPDLESLDQSSEEWINTCFNDLDLQFNPEDMIIQEAMNVQSNISDVGKNKPELEASLIKKLPVPARRNAVLKGKKSYIQTTSKSASSVVYPFAFIKPCSLRGDVTLKDINQKILGPPPSKTKSSVEDSEMYPKSAFSGKPVVGRTKIHTEGGKGSITIMRTKG